MMSLEPYQDRVLTCRDCGREFTFSAGEQEFYASKGLTNEPGRCPDCRAARRNSHSSSTRPRGEQYEAICSNCGRQTTVPFMPREDRPVYCSDCFQEQRAARPPRQDSGRQSYDNNSSYGNSSSYGNGGEGNSRGRGGRGERRERYDRW